MTTRVVTGTLMGDPGPGRTPWSDGPGEIRPVVRGVVQGVVRPSAYIAPEDDEEPLVEAEPEVEAEAPPPEPTEPITTLRPVEAVDLDGAELSPAPTGEPIFERADPRTLLVDAAYQRDLSAKSLALIRKIATEWDWRRFKPPVVAFADGGLQIIDGQHTAIGAACRPDIEMIPVMIVEAPELESRALAFIGHNRDRLNVTPIQLHHAAVAASDPMALTIEAVCLASGAHVVRGVHGSYPWKVGDTVAIVVLQNLIERQGEEMTRLILSTLVEAGRAPVSAHDLKAVELLFTDADYVDQLPPLTEGGAAEVARAIAAGGEATVKEARLFAAAQCVPFWRALAVIWFKKCKKRRRAV